MERYAQTPLAVLALPYDFYTFAEVVKDVTVLCAFANVDATTSWQKAADDTFDVPTNIKLLGFVNANALYSKTEAPDSFDNHRLPIGQSMLHKVLKLHHTSNEGSFRNAAVGCRLFGQFLYCHFALAHCLSKKLTV